MQSGAPTFGTPEPVVATAVLAQLARRLCVPFRSGGALTASKTHDAQAAYESAVALWLSAVCGVNLLQHSAGWLEGGLSLSFEKFLLDCDQVSAMHKLFRGLDMSANGQAMEELLAHEPGLHHLGTAHTQANFQDAFWASGLADSNSLEQWQEEGRTGGPGPGQPLGEEDARRARARRPWIPGLPRASATSSPRRKPPCPTSGVPRARLSS